PAGLLQSRGRPRRGPRRGAAGARARLPPADSVAHPVSERLGIIPRRNMLLGGALLLLLMAVTLLPFASMFTTALHQSGTYPNGLDWPSHPHWGNFVEAFQVANMGAIFRSSVLIVIAVVPVAVGIATIAGFALR